MANFFIQSIFSVSYETYLNLKRLENVLVFVVWLFSHAFFGVILNSLMLTDFWISSSSISVLLFISTALSAYRIAFESNFRLTFPVNELSKKRFILSCFGVSRGSDLQAKVFRSLHIVKWAWLISLNISILLSHVRLTFWDLFSPRTLFNVFLFVVYQQLMAYFVISFVKIFTMESLKLQMPSPYFAAESFLSNKPNLIHALTNEDALFKMFGMKNLRDSTMKDPKERQEVYTLSQPGGHPRNWNSIRDVCLAILRQISSHLEAENVGMQAGNSKFISSLTVGIENPNRAALLLPPTLKPRFLGGIPQSKPLSPLAAFLKPYVEKIQAWYFMDPPVITTYESIMAQYAIESLYLLAMNAFKEDTYGVVQRDLAKIATIFLDFEVNIDTFIRAKNLNPSDKRSISSIQDIEAVLTEALCKLYVQYQDHIDTLNLTKDQLDLWELLVRE
uniref:Nucleoporin NDC1 n=1 Tax=Acrobeloides nanus TaxID=290746 RepID=A0A914DLC3_9BILA